MKVFLRIVTLLIVGVIVVVLISDSTKAPATQTEESSEVADIEEPTVSEEEVVVPIEEVDTSEESVPELPPGWQEDGTVILGGDGIPNN